MNASIDVFDCLPGVYLSLLKMYNGQSHTFLFGLFLYIPVNNYGHVGTISSPNPAPSLTKQLTSISLVTDNNPS